MSTSADQERHLWLGGEVAPATHDRTGADAGVDTADLTTHGVIVGMTGSGKTGLGIVALEEALLDGVPCLVLDPKGDMANLLLTFPELAADDFAPWVPADADAAEVAETWRTGLAGWGIAGERIRALRDRVQLDVYTPGSTAARSLDVVGDLSPPPDGTDAEAVADQIESYVSGLLGLGDIDADPLASREHILLSNLIDHAWSNGEQLDLGRLVAMVQQPPMRKLGVIELETFFPAPDRTALALRLNGLLASPSFAAWAHGDPLDIARLLWPDGDRPAAALMILSTQNPVDLDYKAISNAGTWLIGRLQTERDRDRLLDGMTSASGDVDRGEISATISGLDKREFVLHRTKADRPTVLTSRWAMSYLAGPLTKAQLGELGRGRGRGRGRGSGRGRGRGLGFTRPYQEAFCQLCPPEDNNHAIWYCTKYKTAEQKRERLRAINRCQACNALMTRGTTHTCKEVFCKWHNQRGHLSWTCDADEHPGPQPNS